MGNFKVGLNRRRVLEHRHMEVMRISARIRQQESLVDRIRMRRVARDRTAGLEVLSLVDIKISSIRNLSTPVLSLFIYAFPGGHEILRSSQASIQVGGVFERKKVDIPFVGCWEACEPLDFLFEVVVSDSPRAGLVDRRQLDQVNWCPRCVRIVGVQSSRLSQSRVFLPLDDEVLGSNWGTLVSLLPESDSTSKAWKLVSLKEQINLIREKGCLVFE